MSLFREIFSGYASRIRLENHLQLQKSMQERPAQIRLQVATTLNGIAQELKDPELKAIYDNVVITLPNT